MVRRAARLLTMMTALGGCSSFGTASRTAPSDAGEDAADASIVSPSPGKDAGGDAEPDLRGVKRACLGALVCDDFEDGELLLNPSWARLGSDVLEVAGVDGGGKFLRLSTGSGQNLSDYLLRPAPEPRDVLAFGAILSLPAGATPANHVEVVAIEGMEDPPPRILLKLDGASLSVVYVDGGSTSGVPIGTMLVAKPVTVDVVVSFEPGDLRIFARVDGGKVVATSHSWEGRTGTIRLVAGLVSADLGSALDLHVDDVFFDWK